MARERPEPIQAPSALYALSFHAVTTPRLRRAVLLCILVLLWVVLPQSVMAQGSQDGELWGQDLVSQVQSSALSASGHRVAFGTRDNRVTVYDRQGILLWSFDAENSITSLAWNADGSRLAVASEDRFIYLLDGANGRLLGQHKASRTVNDTAIARDGSLVAATSDDQHIYVLDGEGHPIWSADQSLGVSATGVYGEGEQARVVIGADDGSVTVFSRTGTKLLTTYLDYNVTSLAITRTGARILVGTSDGALTLINGANGTRIWAIEGDSKITDVAMADDGSVLIAASELGTVYFLDSTGTVIQRLQPDVPVRSLALAGDASLLALGDTAGRARLLDRAQQVQGMAQQTRTRNLLVVSGAGLLTLLLVAGVLLILFTATGRSRWDRHAARPRRIVVSVWKSRNSYLLILPTLIFLLTFNYYPAFSGLYHAFTDWNPVGHSPWVGLENFRFLLGDRFFLSSFRNALILVVVSIVKTMTMPLLVAELIFNLKNRYTQYWMRTLFVVPIVLPAVVEILVWNNIYDPSIGLLNEVLKVTGRTEWTRVWYGDPKVALSAIIFIGVPWVNAFALLIFYGGLISISDEIFDSAKVDGANAFRRFWRIDLPLLMGQVKLLLILNFINAVQTFELVFLTTGGGPGDSTYVPALELYYMAMRMDRMGVASAIGMILFLIILAGTVINMRFVKSATEFEA